MPGSDDLLYQPTQETHSFQAPSKNLKPLLLFFITVIGLLAVFVAFLLILNFFNILSLSTIYPKQLGSLPHLTQFFPPAYDAKNKVWTVEGTFYQYNDEKIKVKIGLFKTMDFVYRTDSMLLRSNLPINSTQPPAFQAGTLFDLDQKENLGKNVSIDYKIENKVNDIETTTLYK